MKEELTYEDAYAELQRVIAEIERGEISVDVLAEKVKRATTLFRFCKEKLKSTEMDVQKILEELKGEE